MTSRRQFLGTTAAGLVAAAAGRRTVVAAPGVASASLPLLKPPRLSRGDRVGIISPSNVPGETDDTTLLVEPLRKLGLEPVSARHVGAGRATDDERATDIHEMFEDPSVRALVPVRGGYGSARLLDRLDYGLIRRHPKVLIGYSDVDALLVGVHARTGLVTFHGPMGNSAWGPDTRESVERVLFRAEAARIGRGPGAVEPSFRTITSGTARGRLVGGNLTVLSSIVGSAYLPAADDLVLFVEEVREPLSEVDRMLTHLQLAGILPRVRGFVFGQCTSCEAPQIDGGLTLDAVLDDHVRPLGVPAWRGAPIGHTDRQLTLPIGLPVEIDADRGTIQLLEPAVT